MKLDLSPQFFENYLYIKFQWEPSYIRTERHHEVNSRYSQFCELARQRKNYLSCHHSNY